MMQLLQAETSASLIGQVHLAECLDLCERVYRAGVRVDMILADLPYGTTACAWDTIIPFEPMWKAFKRIIKPRGAIVLTASQPFTSALVMSNPKMFKSEWIWEKDVATGFLDAELKQLKAHESVIVFAQETPTYYPQKINVGRKSNMPSQKPRPPVDVYRPGVIPGGQSDETRYPRSVIKFNVVNSSQGRVHPTQKPVDLFQYLIRTYTQPGELVFDPTCGSGTTARAAIKEGRRFIVGDNEIQYVQVARDSLRLPFEPRELKRESIVSDLPLFAARPA